jgi:hypothetical protein
VYKILKIMEKFWGRSKAQVFYVKRDILVRPGKRLNAPVYYHGTSTKAKGR